MGARTDAARAEVLARRGELVDEVERLEASARAAVDIPAKVKRNPVKMAGAAGGAAFLLLGGPQRVFRRARRAVLGPKADMPRTMLPKEVDRTLRGLGDDGDRVRATVEREFAKWLRERAKLGSGSDAKGAAMAILMLALKPAATQVGKQLAKQVANPDPEAYATALARIRQRTGSRAEAVRRPESGPRPEPGPRPDRAAGSGGPTGSSGGAR